MEDSDKERLREEKEVVSVFASKISDIISEMIPTLHVSHMMVSLAYFCADVFFKFPFPEGMTKKEKEDHFRSCVQSAYDAYVEIEGRGD